MTIPNQQGATMTDDKALEALVNEPIKLWPYEPKPLFFNNDAESAAWVCNKCEAIYGDRAQAAHCCDPNRCRECRAASAKVGALRCAECEARCRARHRKSRRRALEAWRTLPNRAPISTYDGIISDADSSSNDGYHRSLEYLIEHCADDNTDPRTLRLFAVQDVRAEETSDELADHLIERLREDAYDDWDFDGREELVRLLEPVVALLNDQNLGYCQDNDRPLDFDLPWPPSDTKEPKP